MDTGVVLVLITAASETEADKIARALLEKKKAACVNIADSINSLFWWKGKIESAQEKLLLVKTTSSLVAPVIDEVKKTHSYEVPEIIVIPIIDGNKDYLDWVKKTVSQA